MRLTLPHLSRTLGVCCQPSNQQSKRPSTGPRHWPKPLGKSSATNWGYHSDPAWTKTLCQRQPKPPPLCRPKEGVSQESGRGSKAMPSTYRSCKRIQQNWFVFGKATWCNMECIQWNWRDRGNQCPSHGATIPTARGILNESIWLGC